MYNGVITVSVITPAYNPGHGLVDAGLSLAAQSHNTFEWIIVDDGSSAESASVFEEISMLGIERVRVVRMPKNLGQAAARNSGIEQATGKFIKFLDADDLLDEHHLKLLVEAATAFGGNHRIAFAPTRHLFLSTGVHHVNASYQGIQPEPEEQLVRLLQAPFLSHCGALFPAELVRDLGGYDQSLVTDEDGDLLIRALLKGWSFVAVPDCNYIYRHRDTGVRVSNDDSLAKFEARRKVCLKVLEYHRALGFPVPEAIAVSLCRRIDAIAVRAYRGHRDFSQEMFELAASISPSFPRSGSLPERVTRRLFGISLMLAFKSLHERIR